MRDNCFSYILLQQAKPVYKIQGLTSTLSHIPLQQAKPVYEIPVEIC
jgi:hypothetical protein